MLPVAAAAVALGLFFAADLLRTPYCYIDGIAVYDRCEAMRATAYLDGLARLEAPQRMLDALMENNE